MEGSEGMSAEELDELWSRWRGGEQLKAIAQALGRPITSVQNRVYRAGGIEPWRRRRNARSLSLEEREEISRGLCRGLSIRAIARQLGRSPSTVSREVRRNRGREAYRACRADSQAWAKAKRPKACKLLRVARLRSTVTAKLKQDWSPQQIAAWLKTTYPDDEDMQVSHETIYRSLFVQARNVLKKELMAHLRSQKTFRRSHKSNLRGQGRGQIVDAISIRERPAEVEDRAVPGHWEGDLLSGKNQSYIATLVERHSRFVMLVRLKSKDSRAVAATLARHVRKLPAELRRSLTWDRGLEMARHKEFRLATDVDVYFCDPRSPWQRGSNENTNGLLRQYFPKGTDLSTFSQARLNTVAKRLNTRPRKTLEWKTPAQALAAVLR